MLREDPHAERRGDLQHDGRRDVVDSSCDPREHLRHGPSGDEASDDHERESGHGRGRGHRLAHRDRDRDAIDEQRGRVVEQALAFEDLRETMRQPGMLQNRGRCRGIGRRDDGPEREGRGPRQRRHQPLDHARDRDRRDRHRGDDQRGDRDPVLAQVASRRVVGRVEQHRCDEQCQSELRVERDVRHAGHQREGDAETRQQCGVGRVPPPRQCREADRDDEQDEDRFEGLHRRSDACRGRARGAFDPRRPFAPDDRDAIAEARCAARRHSQPAFRIAAINASVDRSTAASVVSIRRSGDGGAS